MKTVFVIALFVIPAFAADDFHGAPAAEGRPIAVAAPQAQPETVEAVNSLNEISDVLQGRKPKPVGERSIPYNYEYFPGQVRQ